METQGVVYPAEELLPAEWRKHVNRGPIRTFNPGLIAAERGWLFAYRVVLADGLRRIAICRLDESLRVRPGSVIPLSDRFRFAPDHGYPEVATQWFADPRLYRFETKLFIYWNSGWHEPRNYQFLQELEPRTLEPLGRPRELLLAGERQKLEKNWTLFGRDLAAIHAVYSISPHVVLRGSLVGTEDIVLTPVASTSLPLAHYPRCHGGLRGGAPPQRDGDDYVGFCHSVHDGEKGYRYAAAAYRFAAAAPYAPTHAPGRFLALHNPAGERRTHPALNPAVGEVLYPCGAARSGSQWLVSHGINDEHCAITWLRDADLMAALTPVAPDAI